jgi:hypothetical protein
VPAPIGDRQKIAVFEVQPTEVHFELPIVTELVVSVMAKLSPFRVNEDAPVVAAFPICEALRTGALKENGCVKVPTSEAIVKITLTLSLVPMSDRQVTYVDVIHELV